MTEKEPAPTPHPDFLAVQAWLAECEKIPEQVNAKVLDLKSLSKLLQLKEPFGKHHGLGAEWDRLLDIIQAQDEQIGVLKNQIRKLERWVNIYR